MSLLTEDTLVQQTTAWNLQGAETTMAVARPQPRVSRYQLAGCSGRRSEPCALRIRGQRQAGVWRS